MAPWKHSTCHTTRLLYQSWMSNVFAIPWNFNSLRRNNVPVPWIIDASDSNTQCLHQKRLFTWKSILIKHNYKLWWGRKHCTWSILTKWLKRVQKGRLAQLGFCISCCLRNMNSYCYGLVKLSCIYSKRLFLPEQDQRNEHSKPKPWDTLQNHPQDVLRNLKVLLKEY